MKFRTEIEVPSSAARICYGSHILSLGSCFSDTIAGRMERLRFDMVSNPLGVVFNPESVARDIDIFSGAERISAPELSDGMWFSYDVHSSLSAVDRGQFDSVVASAVGRGREALGRADWVMITFGTAIVYSLPDGRTVANCHRMHPSTFTRRMLSVDEIVRRYDALLRGPLAGRNVLLTVSPVRHVGDTLQVNSVSKATLRLAAEMLASQYPNVTYFPSFELLVDDLRDYRFYAGDLVHPSDTAVEYIWEKFRDSFISAESVGKMTRVEEVLRAASHRPLHPESGQYRRFCAQMLSTIDSITDVDLSRERAIFSAGEAK